MVDLWLSVEFGLTGERLGSQAACHSLYYRRFFHGFRVFWWSKHCLKLPWLGWKLFPILSRLVPDILCTGSACEISLREK